MTLKSILLIRHAESLEDVDPTMHNIADDSVVGLTEFGKIQAKELGQWIVNKIGPSAKLKVVLSASNRAKETWSVIASGFTYPVEISVDERIRNLNWGSISLETRATIEAERYAIGVLHYCFPGGTNTPEYVQAIDEFAEEVILGCLEPDFPEHIIVITHGFALRVIARSLLVIAEDEFRKLRNPPNGYHLELKYLAEQGRFVATEPLLVVK